ncbi:MAG: 3-oxoacyl-[acyl-carrier-protein] reductase FabG [Chlamydiae bacterium]|nr:3-oxoacyl-[acyl-carrier-protein] reductase FabG [Chlamydiota bacterium]
MHQLLKGKHVLITGGTAGIGKQIALTFASQGASVAIFGTNKERAEQVTSELATQKVSDDQKFLAEIVNVSDKQAIEAAIQDILEKWGVIDVLVNNAGITRDGLLMKMKEEHWDEVMDVNLKSVFNTCQALVRPMMKARSGKIINISSVVGLTGNAGQVNYSASKSGVIGFTKSLAQELATRGICVNCIAPGFISTRMTDALTDVQKEGILKKIPMGRIGDAEEVAKAALFLASDMSTYMTGQVLTVDGGMVM